MTEAALAIAGLTLRFGGLTAIDRLDLHVAAGALHGLIGPNGAGKTSVFNAVSGLVRGYAGTISVGGAAVDRLAPDARARRALARTFQNLRLYGEMTALENVLVGLHAAGRSALWPILTRLPPFHADERAAVARARACLGFVGLTAAAGRPAAALAYGDRRRLEIARALAAGPRLLLLDEPAAGLNPAETAALNDLLLAVKAQGVAMLLVEHDMSLVMRLCDSITVLNFGCKIAEGAPEAVRRDPAVIAAYLGGAEPGQAGRS